MGANPWGGCASQHRLLEALINSLKMQDIYHLEDAVNPKHSSILHRGWKNTNSLGLQVEEVIEWNNYVQKLLQNAIRLRDDEDELMWSKNSSSRRFTTH
jgi:hypothetical protein